MGPSAFAAWSNFYVITGSASAALTGLMFVVVTLAVENRNQLPDERKEGFATYTTPTVVHFCCALLLSVVAEVPWPSLHAPAVVICIAGILGFVYTLNIARLTRRHTIYDADIEDWLSFAIVPALVFALIGVGGALLQGHPNGATFVVGAGTLLMIFLGIRNAWDVVTYLAIQRTKDP